MRIVAVGVALSVAGCNSLAGLDTLAFGGGGPGGGHEGGAAGASTGASGGAGGGADCPEGLADCDASGDCETDLASDARHCGVCGRDCGESGCTAGRCEPLTLATGQGGPSDVEIHAGHAYWVNSENGELRRCALTGCGGNPELVGQSSYFSFYVTVGGGYVYWNDNDDSQLWRCPLAGCAGNGLWSTAVTSPTQIHLDGDWLYVHTYAQALHRVDTRSGAATTILTGTGNHGELRADGSDLFWSEVTTNSVWRCVLADDGSCAMPIQIASGFAAPNALVIDASHAYAGEDGGPGSRVVRIPRSATGTEQNEVLATGDSVRGMALSDTHLYWIEPDALARLALPDGAIAETIAAGLGNTRRLAVGEGFAVVTIGGTDDGEVRRYAW